MPADPGAPATPTAWQLRWYWVARGLVEVFCRAFWRVELVGLERLPATGAYVIAPVHRSNVDTLLCGCLTRRRIRFMGKDTLWRYRWSGALFGSLGAFPVQRGVPDRLALRTCETALAAGEPVVLFPEGTRQSGPVVAPLLEGAVFVAARAGVPIVPVGIGGSEWAMPKGHRGLRPVKLVVVVGDPLPPPRRTTPGPAGQAGLAGTAGTNGLAGTDIAGTAGTGGGRGRISRRSITEASEALRAELQRLFDDAMLRAGRPTG